MAVTSVCLENYLVMIRFSLKKPTIIYSNSYCKIINSNFLTQNVNVNTKIIGFYLTNQNILEFSFVIEKIKSNCIKYIQWYMIPAMQSAITLIHITLQLSYLALQNKPDTWHSSQHLAMLKSIKRFYFNVKYLTKITYLFSDVYNMQFSLYK